MNKSEPKYDLFPREAYDVIIGNLYAELHWRKIRIELIVKRTLKSYTDEKFEAHNV